MLTYTVIVQHTSASTAPAYQAVARVWVPESLHLLADTINITHCSDQVSEPQLTLVENGIFDVSVAEFQQPAAGAQTLCWTVRYQARVQDTVRPNQAITTSAAVNWTSTPTLFSRPGRQRGLITNGSTTAQWPGAVASHSSWVLHPTLDMSLFWTSLVDTPGSSVNVGEEAMFQLCFMLSEAVANISLTVVLDSGLSFLNASVQSIGANLEGSPLAVGALVANMSLPAGPTVVFDFAEVTNHADNIQDDKDTICVLVAGAVSDK